MVSFYWLSLSIDFLFLLIVSFYLLSLSIDCLSLFQYLIYFVLIRSNTQVCRNLAQNSYLHPWAALCCLLPRRQTGAAEVCHQTWFSWQCSKSGQRCVPGGPFGSVISEKLLKSDSYIPDKLKWKDIWTTKHGLKSIWNWGWLFLMWFSRLLLFNLKAIIHSLIEMWFQQ